MYSLLAYLLIGFCFLVCYSIETLLPIQIGYSMTSKNTPPALSKTTRPEPTSNRLKSLIAIILLLLLIVIAYFVWSRVPSSVPTPVKDTPTESEQAQADSTIAKVDKPESADGSLLADSSIEPSETELQISDPKSETILSAPLPETDSLAKEEVDRLEDEHQRLAEQERLATEQVQMNKKLTDMKAEQIKLLEQQIAQLESAQPAE